MEFDIFNPDTWHLVKEDDIFHIDGRDVYVGDFSEKMKLADFVKFISEFILIGEKQFGNFSLERKRMIVKNWLIKFYKYNTIEGRAELPAESPPLSPETEDKNESGFIPLDESTWNLAGEKRIMRIKGIRLINDKVFMSEKDFLHEIEINVNYKNNKPVKEIVEEHLNLCFSLYAEKDLEPVFIVNYFSFTKALCDTCRDTNKETLEQIAKAMNSCMNQNLKKNQFKQYFFDNFIPADNEFFIEIYFAEKYSTLKNIDDLIVSFYSEFEPETRKELNKILQESLYLKAHTYLIPQIKECFEGCF